MRIDPSHEYIFGATGAKRWLSRPRVQRANAVLPRTMEPDPRRLSREDFVWADEPAALRLKERLQEQLNKEFPVDTLPSGFCGPSGVPDNYDVLRNVSGIGMDPLPIPLTSNDSFVESAGVADKIRPLDRPWLAELVRLFFGGATPTDLHIRKAASFSFPYFATDNTYKKLAVLKALRNPDDFLRSMTGGTSDLDDGLNDYHAILLYAIHERQQANRIVRAKDGSYSSRPRTAPTEEEARQGKYLGKTTADMRARRADGTVIEGHFCMRRRDVFGGNGVVNYFLSAFFGAYRSVYLERFKFTYKTRGSADKAERVSRFKHVIGSDVKTMDKLIPRWFLKEVCDLLPAYMDERVVELVRRAYQAPFVCPPPWAKTPDSYNPVFGGDPRDPKSFANHPGLPSGIAINPDWGKLWMTFVYSVLYRDVGALHSPSQLEAFLQGRNPDHALMDMSDDAVFMTNIDRVASALLKPSSPYAILEVETPVIFLGDVFTSLPDGRKEAYPNPVTFFANMLCREDSIDRAGPVPYARGYLARLQVYQRMPTFRDALRILETTCRAELGFNPTLLAQQLAVHEPLSEIDAMVRANPAVIHYKVDPSTVSKELLDEIVATIPHTDFFSNLRPLYKVPVQ